MTARTFHPTQDRPGYVEFWRYEYGWVAPNGEHKWVVADQYGNGRGPDARDAAVDETQRTMTRLGVEFEPIKRLRRKAWTREYRTQKWVSDQEVER